MLHAILEALFVCATNKNSYLVGSLSVVMFTLSYYVAFPPLVRNRCLPLLSQPQQHSLLTHREQYDVIVPYNASWLTHRSPQFRLSGGHDVLVFLHMQKTGGTQVDQFLTQHVRGAPCVCEGHKSCVCNRPHLDSDSPIAPATSQDTKRESHSDYDYDAARAVAADSDDDYHDSDDYGGEKGQKGGSDTWLYSRSSTYRAACGVHADWTELTTCVPELLNQQENPNPHRRFFYFTILREPVGRFVSEWRHVKRGATWKSSRHQCNHRQYQVPTCYNGSDWSGVSMEQFVSCPFNLAFNRQTRMLADLSLVHCYNFSWSPLPLPSSYYPSPSPSYPSGGPVQSEEAAAAGRPRPKSSGGSATETKLELEAKLLHSAKSNLLRMASFGLLSEYEDTQKLLSATLGLQFDRDLLSRKTHSESFVFEPELMQKIQQVNKLDIELFQFATKVFQQRVQTLEAATKEDSS